MLYFPFPEGTTHQKPAHPRDIQMLSSVRHSAGIHWFYSTFFFTLYHTPVSLAATCHYTALLQTCFFFVSIGIQKRHTKKKKNHVMKKMQSSHALQEPRMSCLQVLAQPSGSHTHSSPAFSTPNLMSLFENLQPRIALMSCTKKAPHYDIRHKGAVKDILYPPSIFIKALPIPLTACI